MGINRRNFFKVAAVTGAGACAALSTPAQASGPALPADPGYGMLNDSTRCIGCKACQTACKKVNELPSEGTLEDGGALYDSPRALSDSTYTLIKMHRDEQSGEATFVKQQCMHCLDPACKSACLVGAFVKEKEGAVTWDGGKCMGCRYCMVACPYNVPQFEWHKAIPDISKCTLCHDTRLTKGKPTACAEVCPADAITFGHRDELLRMARARIAAHPEKYDPHVYGENEVGGTNVLYLTKPKVGFASLGLPAFGYIAPPRLTESIQHGVFKYFIPPVAIYAALGGILAFNQRRNKLKGGTEHE
ncbi:hydrogenase 2 operon protein HybA [Geoalkalibacter sp.]|uniref:hydrogenase 2 operon protein HybA n=1 Tax=Geoalkalibacter sp. TaxID=3041440 RepID=UPI00272EA56A|nr:hydrogenase 2 operon protein HybA [Geoalkalibacter sp.]